MRAVLVLPILSLVPLLSLGPHPRALCVLGSLGGGAVFCLGGVG